MKRTKKKLLWVVVPIFVLLIATYSPAQEQSHGDQSAEAKPESPAGVPEVADIIPLAAKLAGRLAVLENSLKGWDDPSATERKCAEIEASLESLAGQVQQLRESKKYEYELNDVIVLRNTMEQEEELVERAAKPLRKGIRQLEIWRKEWQAEKIRWNAVQSSLLKERGFDQLESTVTKAHETVDRALNLIISHLETMLTAQEKVGNIQETIYALDAELDRLMLAGKRSTLLQAPPPLISSQYISQFGSELWHAVAKGLQEIAWPDITFFARLGWIVFLQAFLSLVVIIAVYRNRHALYDSKTWRFLAARPFSSGFFFGIGMTFLLYDYWHALDTLKLAYTVIGGVSFGRIIGALVEASWKRHFVYGLIVLGIATRALSVAGIPVPIMRLYITLSALVGLLYSLRWTRESLRLKQPVRYAWSLRALSLFFFVIIFAQLWGKSVAAEYLFMSLLRSIAIVLTFALLIYMIRGGLGWLFGIFLRRATAWHGDTDTIIRQSALFVGIIIWGVILPPALLGIWGFYVGFEGAIKGFWAFGFNLGSHRISLGLLLAAAALVYASFLISWILQRLLMHGLLIRRRVEKGVQHAMGRLIHYVIILVGFMLALSALGLQLTQLTIMLSALGVGIGFGLQGVVNNFVSGLILLFERPVRVGDYIEFEGQWAIIRRIGLRATTVQTFDQADVIIPNADLVTNQVTNWTLSSRQVRLIVPVGVAYGSDIPLVMETLMACAKENPLVSEKPAPQVLFLNFGESSLDFDLRVWVGDADNRLKVGSELRQEIDRRFREAKIEIAFPQRDLHLRSVDSSIVLQPPETAK